MSRMRVLNANEVKVFFPVGPFLLERFGAKTDLNPANRTVAAKSSLLHIAKVFAAGHRALPDRPGFDRLKQIALAT